MFRKPAVRAFFAFFILFSPLLQAEIITLSTGEIISAGGLTFDGQFVEMTVGSQSRRIPKNDLRDISFAGQNREADEIGRAHV